MGSGAASERHDGSFGAARPPIRRPVGLVRRGAKCASFGTLRIVSAYCLLALSKIAVLLDHHRDGNGVPPAILLSRAGMLWSTTAGLSREYPKS
jgi:hypothetical protein